MKKSKFGVDYNTFCSFYSERELLNLNDLSPEAYFAWKDDYKTRFYDEENSFEFNARLYE